MKEFVTIVGFNSKDPGKRHVTIGTELIFIKEHENKYDPNAIKVYHPKHGSVGYVANSSHTVSKGTRSATDVYHFFEEETKGVVKNIIDMELQRKDGTKMSVKSFVAELELQETRGEEKMEKKEKTLKFRLVGSKTLYPKKYEIGKVLENGEIPIILLKKSEDKIVAEFDGGLCGVIDETKSQGLSPYEDIESTFDSTPERKAKIIQQVGTKYIGEIYINEEELQKEKNEKALQDIIEHVIEEEILTKEEIEERMDYLKEAKVTEKQMINVFETMRKYDDNVKSRIPLKPKTLYKDTSGIVKRVVGYINLQKHLLFEGDRGVGKNVLIETLAWVYNRPLYEFSLNSQHDNNSLLGGKTIETDDDGNMKMTYDPESIIQAAEVGGILNFDEFNTSLSHVMSIFNSLLDDRRRIQVPGYKLVKADPNFVVIATQNKDYRGTFETSEATIDRFTTIVFPKLKSISDIIVAKIPSVDYQTLKICNDLYGGIKRSVENSEISDKAITIRGFVDAILATQQDIPLKEALIDNVAHRTADDEERKIIINMINAILG